MCKRDKSFSKAIDVCKLGIKSHVHPKHGPAINIIDGS